MKLLAILCLLLFSCSPRMKVVYVQRSDIGGKAGLYLSGIQTAFIAEDLNWWQRIIVEEHERDHHLFGNLEERLLQLTQEQWDNLIAIGLGN